MFLNDHSWFGGGGGGGLVKISIYRDRKLYSWFGLGRWVGGGGGYVGR